MNKANKWLLIVLFTAVLLGFFGLNTNQVKAGTTPNPITELFISEYAEGNSNNKWIEIYNGTDNPVSLNNYKLAVYSNGSSSGSSISFTLNTTIQPGDVYVISNNNASVLPVVIAQSDQRSGSITFNGDDAVALLKNDVVIDVFGVIGNDPGTSWTIGLDVNATVDKTVIRKSNVYGPKATWDATEWEVYPVDTTTYVGSHTVVLPEPEPEVVFVPNGSLDELDGSFLLIGDYLFDLTEGSLDLKSFLRASQTAFLNTDTGEYEMYLKIGTRWYNMASDTPYAQSFSSEQINGGQGYKYFDGVHISEFQLITNKTQKLGYQDLQAAINAANPGDLIVLNGDIEIESTLYIDESITLEGSDYALIAKQDFGKNNSEKHSINIFADDVTIQNLVVEALDFTFGVQAYGSQDTVLTDVTIKDSKGAALTVNGASVVANGLVTSGSAWGAINVDSQVSTPSAFTLVNSTLNEDLQIWSEEALAAITAVGYSEYVYENGIRVFTTGTIESKVNFVSEGRTFVFETIQAAINAATEGLTIHVNEGVYVVPTGIQITKPNLTLQAHGLVEIKYALNPTAPSPYNVTGISVLANLGTVTVDGFTVSGFESGIVQSMSQSAGTSFIVSNNTVYPGYNNGALYMRNGIQVTGNGSQVISNTVIGAPLTSTWSGTAIGVVNASNVLVEDNNITDSLYDIGISVMNWNSQTAMTNIMVRNNHITNAKNAFRVSGNVVSMLISDVTFEGNTVVGPVTAEGIWVYALNVQTVTVDDILFIDNNVTFNNTNNLLIRLSTSSIATNVVLDEAGTKTAVVNTQNELKSLVSAEYSGDINNIRFGSNISITSQVSVNRTVTLDGHGFALVATQDFGNINGYKHSMNVYADDVQIQNLTISAASFTFGVQAYQAENLTLNQVQITNSKGAGLSVNGSSVTASNLVTSGNAWGAINVNSGVGVTAISALTLINSTLNENLQIWSEDQIAVVDAFGYNEFVYENNVRVFTNRTYTPEISIIRGEVTYVFQTLQGAVNGALNGETILISADITQTQTVHVSKSVIIDGQGYTLTALSAFSTVNGYKQSMNVYADNVVIKNLIIDANAYTFGVQAYQAQNMSLIDVTIANSLGAGLTVNGSSVTATNLITSNNTWGAINVDSGVGVNEISALTFVSGTLNENLQIWSEDQTAIVNAIGFEAFVFVNSGNVRVFTNRPYSPEVSIIRGEVTYVYSSVQNAIAAAQVGEEVHVKAGTYAFPSKVWITKDVTIIGETGVVFSSNGNDILGIQPGIELTISNVKFLGTSHVGIDMAAGAILNGTNLSFEGLTTGIYVNPNGVVRVSDSTFKDLIASIGTDTKARYFTLENNTFEDVGEVLGFTASNDTKRNFDLLAAYVVANNSGVTLEQVIAYGAFIVAINETTGVGYTSIQAAINAAQVGQVIGIEPGTYTLTQQLIINKAITLKGIEEVIIEAAVNFNLGTYNADRHLVSIVGVNGVVTLENLIVMNSKRSGINVFESTDVRLIDITAMDNVAAGVAVVNSKVTATNLITSGNGWSSVNVDNGSAPGANAPATEFILVSGSIQMAYSNAGNVSVVMPEGYYTTNYFGYPTIKHIWSEEATEITTGAVIEVDAYEVNVYATVQLAIAAAQVGEEVHVKAGTYAFPSKVWITKDVTIIGETGVVFSSNGNDILGIQPGIELTISNVKFLGTSHVGIDMAAGAILNGTNLSFEGLTTGIYVNPNGVVRVSDSTFKDLIASIGTDTKARYFTLENNTFEDVGEVLGFTASNDTKRNFDLLAAYVVANNSGVTLEQVIAYGAFIVAINETTGVGYTSIQAAINAAQVGQVIGIEPGTYTLTQQLIINKAITLKGIEEVIIEAAVNFNLGTYNADRHLVSIVGVNGVVTLENLIVMNSKRSGINVFESTDVRLIDITAMDNVAAGVAVVNSKVTATNLITSGNGWSSVNVDNGSAPGANAPATEFILVSGSIQMAYSNAGNVSVVMPEGYYTTNYFGYPTIKHIWSEEATEITTGAVIEVDAYEVNVYATVQLAIAAAQDGGTIEVLPGTYTFASRVDMIKNLTIEGQEGVVFNSTNPSIFVVQSGKVLTIDGVTFTGGNAYAIELSANSGLVVTNSTFRTKYGIYVNTNGMLTVSSSLFEVTGGVAIGTDTKAATLWISGNTFAEGLGEALGFTAVRDIEANFLALEAELIANNTGATAANINSYGTFSKDYAMVVALMASVDELDYTNASWSTYQAIVDGNSVSESSTLAQTSQAYDNIKAAQQQLVIATVFNTTRGLRYASIQVAINEALAFEVIEISEGTYDGFVVNKSNLTIQAEADKDVFITPNYFATGSVSQYMAILVSGATNVKLDGLQIVGKNEYVGLAGFNGAGVIVDNMHFENLVRGILVNTNNPGSGYISNFVITNSSFENLLVGVGGTEDSVLSASNNTFALMRSGSEGFGIGAGVTLSQTLPGLLKANTFTLTDSNYALVDYRTSPATQYGKVLYLSSASTFNSLIDATFFTEVHFTSSISSITLTRPVNIDFGNYAVNRIYILTQDTGTMTLSGTQFVNSLLEVNAPNVVINNYLAVFGTLNIIAGTFNDFS